MLDWDVYRKSKQFCLNERGKIFLENVPPIAQLRYIDDSWMEDEFFFAFVKSFEADEIQLFKEIPQSDKESLVAKFLFESFNLFRTMRIPRITASQFLLYTCIRLACDYHIVCRFNDLKRMLGNLSRSEAGGYRFRWSAANNDGYILKT